jgi:hypothetical protein
LAPDAYLATTVAVSRFAGSQIQLEREFQMESQTRDLPLLQPATTAQAR